MTPTPIDSITLDGREFLIKRDDLFDPYLSGNKFRKLYTLLTTPKENYLKIISYGGTQSNAMLALAKLCHEKGWEFIYYTKPLSKEQKKQKVGNYFLALKLGMKHIEVPYALYHDTIATLTALHEPKTLLVHQGGAITKAEDGIKILADEIIKQSPDIDAIALPSGTGTTALFLAKNLPHYRIYTTSVVGDTNYLQKQMMALSKKLPKNLTILESDKKYPFAKPKREFFVMYEKLKVAGVEFDLLYAPLMWKLLLEQTKEKILYIHTGGVSGNASMLKRYR